MGFLPRTISLVAFGTCYAIVGIVGAAGAVAQETSRIDGTGDRLAQNEFRPRDDFRPRSRERITLPRPTPPTSPPAIPPAAPPAVRPPIATWPVQRPVRVGWQLGVHADETTTGMLITSVTRGSAADRAGLERGDRIVAVGEKRVGIVDNRVVSMRSVLNRKADSRGRVTLLVDSRRHRGLTNVSVRLDGVGGTQIFSN